jgi:hypothetical protein
VKFVLSTPYVTIWVASILNLEIQVAESSFTVTFVIFQRTEFYSVPEDKSWKLNVSSLCVRAKN